MTTPHDLALQAGRQVMLVRTGSARPRDAVPWRIFSDAVLGLHNIMLAVAAWNQRAMSVLAGRAPHGAPPSE